MRTYLMNSLRIARREVRGGARGFRIFFLCLLPGVIAVGGIGVFAAAVEAGLLQNARALLGGDIEVRLMHRPASTEELVAFRALGVVSEVSQLRAMPFSPETEQRALVEVKSVDEAYPLYGEMLVIPELPLSAALGRQSDGAWGTVVEQGVLDRLGVAVESELEFGDIRLRIMAVIDVEPDRSLTGFMLGPRVLLHHEALRASGLLGPESLVDHRVRIALQEQGDEKSVAARLIRDFPDAGLRVRTWQEAEPRIQEFIERMAFQLSLVGLCALLAGGVGIHGAVRGYIDRKIQHIATLKCMGASSNLVLSGYLLQIMFMAILAVLTGCLVAASVPWLGRAFVGSILPIQSGFYSVPIMVAAAFGLLTAFLFSLHALDVVQRVPASALFRGYRHAAHVPVSRGVRVCILLACLLLVALVMAVSEHRNLALWFAVGATVVFACFRWLTVAFLVLLRRIKRPRQVVIRMALAAMQRPGSTASQIVFALSIGLTTLVIIAQVQANLYRLVMDALPEDAPLYFVMDIQSTQIDEFVSDVSGFTGVDRVDASPILRGRITSIKGVAVEDSLIDPSVRWAVRGDRFVTYRVSLPDGNQLVRGVWWNEFVEEGSPPLVSVTSDIGAGLGVEPGDRLGVNILGREMEVEVANWREVDWGSLQMNFALVFHPSALSQAPASWLAAIHAEEDHAAEVFRMITERFANATVIGTRDILQQAAYTIQRIGLAFRSVGMLALFAGFLVLAGAVAADQQRRVREAVIAKVCGATRQDLMLSYIYEFVILVLVGLILSVVVGSVAAYGIVRGLMNITYQLSMGQVFLTLVPGVMLAIGMGLGGTWHVLGQRPSRHLRTE